MKLYMENKVQFDWDDANIAHIGRHGVSPAEAEEAVANTAFAMASVLSNDERRMVCAGRTAAGRVLKVVYTFRTGKVRIVTAHEDRKLRRML